MWLRFLVNICPCSSYLLQWEILNTTLFDYPPVIYRNIAMAADLFHEEYLYKYRIFQAAGMVQQFSMFGFHRTKNYLV